MNQKIAVFGGSFNPPGLHHRAIVERLAAEFDRVLVVPCGPRPDKPVTNDVAPVHRATMCARAFRGLERVDLELFDLEEAGFSRTWELQERFAERGELWHVIGTDLVAGGAAGRAVIQREWARGERIWEELRFAVFRRPGSPLDEADLPPKHRLFEAVAEGASSDIRARAFNHLSLDGLLARDVATYVERHSLYRGVRPPRSTRLALDGLRPLVVADPWNGAAQEVAAKLGPADEPDPDLIVVVGGDGTMLRAIRAEWHRRVPFFGVNTGHLGFLLNAKQPADFAGREVVVEQLPLLAVEVERADGGTAQALAFNEAWVERATGQTAWLQVKVNGEARLDRLVADGALVSTAAGSAAYARAMGAHPVPLNTPALLLVGSNVLQPAFLRPAVLPLDASVELTTLDRDKRPLKGYIDGQDQGEVVRVACRVSRTAAVELAFDPDLDPAEKLARIQFPLADLGE